MFFCAINDNENLISANDNLCASLKCNIASQPPVAVAQLGSLGVARAS